MWYNGRSRRSTFEGENMDAFSRMEGLFGKDGIKKLSKAGVLLFGVGGVGSYVAEALARAGIGSIALVDSQDIEVTNINRQIHATYDTIGMAKTEVMKERLLRINPGIKVTTYKIFYGPDDDTISMEGYDYIVDAVDTVSAKIAVIENAKKAGIPVISCMGAGNKLDPTRFKVADISKTSVDPLAKVMRKELKKRGIESVKVVFSEEIPATKNVPPSSVSFVPSVAGLIIAGEVIKDISGINLRINKSEKA